MSDIFFHYNVADKWDYACRWLRKAWGRGLRVGVVGPPAVLQTLDTLLWSSPSLRPTDFVAHALHGVPYGWIVFFKCRLDVLGNHCLIAQIFGNIKWRQSESLIFLVMFNLHQIR